MTFATPILAGIAAAIAIPLLILLYFLKLRRRDVEVSTTLLWKKAIQDLQANAPFQKLRNNILLLLQLLALILALLAIAQPERAGEGGAGQRLIILIDRSASMTSLDAGDRAETARLEDAKAQALALIDTMREPGPFDRADDAADQAMVIAFDATAEIVSQFTSDRSALRAAVESIQPTDTPSRLKEAFRLAQAQRPQRFVEDEGLNTGPAFVFHLFSDGRLPDAEEALPGSQDQVVYHVIGSESAANIGITALRAERAYDEPSQLSIFVGVQNTDRQRRTVDCELAIDGQTVSVREITIPAATAPTAGEGAERWTPGSGGVVFELDQPAGLIASVVLRTGDDPAGDVLAVDNRGWLVVPPARQTSVAVVTEANFFIADALAGMPLSRLDLYTPDEFQRAAEQDKTAIYDVVLLDRWLPEVPPERSLPPGRWLVLGDVPTGEHGLIDLGLADPAQIIVWSRAHPVLRGLTLDALTIIESRSVDLPEGSPASVIAETQYGPAIIELPGPDFRALVVPFDVMETNWPFQASFVLFLARAIDYLDRDVAEARQASGAARQFRPGEVLTDRLPQGAASVRVDPPDGAPAQRVVPATDGRVVYGPLKATGLYRLRWEGPAGPVDAVADGLVSRTYAANLLDEDESDVPAAPGIILASQEVSASETRNDESVKRYWPYLLLAVLAVLMLEWYIYNRKVAV
jgi:hypothetical protein